MTIIHEKETKKAVARKLSDSTICEHGDCYRAVTDIVYSRHQRRVMLCCERHADVVVDEDCPEYQDSCENCGCRQGVN